MYPAPPTLFHFLGPPDRAGLDFMDRNSGPHHALGWEPGREDWGICGWGRGYPQDPRNAKTQAPGGAFAAQ